MKRMMEHLINVIQKEDLETMFGVGSKVLITSINYCTNKKQFIIHSKLLATFNNETEIFESTSEVLDFYPAGLNLLIREGWKYSGFEPEITIVNKIEVN
jgi:hypothetical protein